MSVSDNVGHLQLFLEHTTPCTLEIAPFRSRRITCHTQPRLASIISRSGTQSDPCISSVRRSIMIASSNSPDGESESVIMIAV